jgi:amino acid transporter
MEKLRQGLSYVEAMAISVAIMAPTAAMALNGSLVASIVGSSVPLTFLVAMIIIGLVSFAFIQFNRHFATSGSVYVFTGASLGPKVGYLSGWTLLLTYFAFTGCNLAEIGAFVQSLLSYFGVYVEWIVVALFSAILIWGLVLLDVRVSARVMLIFETISIGLILILCFVIVEKGGVSHHLTIQPFALNGNSVSSLGLATVFAFLSFAGFEGASTLGEETRNPKRAIPLAIASAVFITGTFYVFVTYAQSIGFGLSSSGVRAFSSSSAPLGDLANTYMSKGFAAAIMFGAVISAFSSALGSVTAGSRLLYSMGRDGFIHSGLGKVNARFGTPSIAVTIMAVVGVMQVVPLSGHSGTDVFGWLGAIGVLALLLVYMATNVGSVAYFVRKKIWKGGILVIPVLSIVMLAYILYANVYPIPNTPYNYFPYIVIAWIFLGFLIMLLNPQFVTKFSHHLAHQDESEGR